MDPEFDHEEFPDPDYDEGDEPMADYEDGDEKDAHPFAPNLSEKESSHVYSNAAFSAKETPGREPEVDTQSCPSSQEQAVNVNVDTGRNLRLRKYLNSREDGFSTVRSEAAPGSVVTVTEFQEAMPSAAARIPPLAERRRY